MSNVMKTVWAKASLLHVVLIMHKHWQQVDASQNLLTMLIMMTLLLYNVWVGSRTTLRPNSSSELCNGNSSVLYTPSPSSTGTSITLSQLCRLFAATYTQASNCTSVAFRPKVDIFLSMWLLSEACTASQYTNTIPPLLASAAASTLCSKRRTAIQTVIKN